MAVKFLAPAQIGTLYNKGEIAAFTPEQEKQLIEAKVAVAYDAKKSAADKAAAEKAAADKAAAEKAAAEKAGQ